MKQDEAAIGKPGGRLRGRIPAGVAVFLLAAAVARAQVGSLIVGNSAPVTNALGQPFQGVNGFPEISARVEIREVGPGIAAPDPGTGEGNGAVNPLVRASYIGHDVPFANSGLFSETFSNRLAEGVWYFARVYDAPAPGSSLYYANSVAFEGPPSSVSSFDVVFQGRRLVNGEPDLDTDGDGIPDAMEGDMGLDPNSADTDGDGYGDYFEAVNGGYLNANEPDAEFDVQIRPAAGSDPHAVSWWTIPVPGLFYRLEYIAALPFEEEFTEDIWSGTATETNVQVDVEEWVETESPMGFFRVRAGPAVPP